MRGKVFHNRSALVSGWVLSGLILLVAAIIMGPAWALAEQRLIVKDDEGYNVFTVDENGNFVADGLSFPVAKIKRTVDFATAGRGVAAFELVSSGDMQDTFGPSFEFWISDNTHTALKAIASFEATRAGGDTTGKLEVLTSNNGTLGYRMTIDPTGKVGIGNRNPAHPLHMASGAYCSAGGMWIDGSSREYKEDIKNLTAEEAAKALVALQPVKFKYKAEPTDEAVGFIAEDVPDLVATGDRKGMSPMDVVAVLTKVVQEQQKTIEELQQRIAALE